MKQTAKERAQILMRLKAGYKPIHKYNNGLGATLCNKCSIIITTGLQDVIMCESCIKEIEVKLIDEDKEWQIKKEQSYYIRNTLKNIIDL